MGEVSTSQHVGTIQASDKFPVARGQELLHALLEDFPADSPPDISTISANWDSGSSGNGPITGGTVTHDGTASGYILRYQEDTGSGAEDRLTLDQDGNLAVSADWDDGGDHVLFGGDVTDTSSAASSDLIRLSVVGEEKFSVSKLGAMYTRGSIEFNDSLRLDAAGRRHIYSRSNTGFVVHPWHSIGWAATTNVNSRGTALHLTAADHVTLHNGLNPQRFDVANTWTSATDHEVLSAWWDSNVAYVGPRAGSGGGTVRPVRFQMDNSNYLLFSPNLARLNVAGGAFYDFEATSFGPVANNSRDLGKSGQAWRDLRVGRDIYATGLPTSDPAVAGQVWNDAGTLKVSAG